jgi:hypothetical protein
MACAANGRAARCLNTANIEPTGQNHGGGFNTCAGDMSNTQGREQRFHAGRQDLARGQPPASIRCIA